MNPTAIYSKSGKGVQEAGGKTSHLSRPDRAVLSAIDGRATLADVAQKVGKQFDPAFQKVIEALDKGGFIREISPGVAPPAPAAKPAAGGKPGAKPTAPMDAASDLDFTSFSTPGTGRPLPPPQAPPRAAPPPPKHTATIPPAPPPPTAAEKAKAEVAAKEQQDAMAKAREEAERKAAAERERLKAEAEAKMRSEAEAKMRADADLKAKEAEAKIKAAQEAAARVAAEAKAKAEAEAKLAAEAKAKAEAEAKRAREEAERARKEAEAEAKRVREEAERARKAAEAEAKRAREEAERARREAEEKAERARKEAEEKAERARKEAEEKARREQEELKRKLEEERKKLEEERREREEERKREEAEREARRKRDEEERAQRRIQEERERVERRRQEKEEEEERAKRKGRDDDAEEEKPKAKPKSKPKPEPEPARPPASGGFADSLMADLESFTSREETEAKEKEEAERKAKEEAAKRAREAEERRQKEEAARREQEEKQRKKEEAEARKRAEERELKEKEERERRRLQDEEEKRKKEAEERQKKAKQEESLAARSVSGGGPRGEGGMSEEESLRRRRERQLGPAPHGSAKERARGGWGKPIGIALFLLLVVALGVAHIMPIDVADYRQAAEDALGQPVKIGSARLSLVTGLQLKFNDVVVGETRISEVRAYPEFDALTGPRKRFSRIEIDGLKLNQQVFGAAVFARAKGDNFQVGRVVVKHLELVGPLVFPKGLEIDALLDREGMVHTATVRGPDALLVKASSKEGAMDVELSSANLSMPFAPEVTLSKFSLKGTATPRGMSVSEWDGQALNGTVSGTANLRWGDTWVVDGVLTARNIYAAVFAPALLSEGRGEGSAKFSMRGEPGKLAEGTRLDGSFTVTNGSLGSIDLSRAIQSGGKQATGRTQFKEMNGQAVYDRGAVTLRNVTLSAGQLNGGASVDIAQNGALSGRIVADVRVSSQTLRATLNLGGTLKEPQVRN